MATNILMPKWGMSMREGLVGAWLKNEGDPVEQGEAIVEVESEKAINLVEAPASGVLARILVPEGETVPITTVIAVITEPGEEVPESILESDGQDSASSAQESPAPPASAAAEGTLRHRSHTHDQRECLWADRGEAGGRPADQHVALYRSRGPALPPAGPTAPVL